MLYTPLLRFNISWCGEEENNMHPIYHVFMCVDTVVYIYICYIYNMYTIMAGYICSNKYAYKYK